VRVPLWALDDDDVAMLVAHERGLDFTVPLALDRLAANPLRGGQRGPGALLLVVCAVPDTFWQREPAMRARIAPIVAVALGAELPEGLRAELDAAREVFG
jgi:hypothetical protein